MKPSSEGDQAVMSKVIGAREQTTWDGGDKLLLIGISQYVLVSRERKWSAERQKADHSNSHKSHSPRYYRDLWPSDLATVDVPATDTSFNRSHLRPSPPS